MSLKRVDRLSRRLRQGEAAVVAVPINYPRRRQVRPATGESLNLNILFLLRARLQVWLTRPKGCRLLTYFVAGAGAGAGTGDGPELFSLGRSCRAMSAWFARQHLL